VADQYHVPRRMLEGALALTIPIAEVFSATPRSTNPNSAKHSDGLRTWHKQSSIQVLI
jgi:hypothetical protein